MALMYALCGVVFLGIVAIWRWGHLDVQTPWADDETWPLSASEALRRYAWYVTVGLVASLVSGVVVMGIGGRLAMRLLAITAGTDARGRITEADQVVGEITLDGTLGFVVFFGLVAGFVFGMAYMVIRHWLPRGWWGGFTYGTLLLVLFASRVDPLRPDNEDFDIVGPGWLAVVVFVLMGWAYGMLLSALAGRFSRALPPLATERRVLLRYTPLLVLVPLYIFLVPIAIGAAVAVVVTRVEGLDSFIAAPRTMLAGRALGIAVVVVAAPGFVIAVSDIATR